MQKIKQKLNYLLALLKKGNKLPAIYGSFFVQYALMVAFFELIGEYINPSNPFVRFVSESVGLFIPQIAKLGTIPENGVFQFVFAICHMSCIILVALSVVVGFLHGRACVSFMVFLYKKLLSSEYKGYHPIVEFIAVEIALLFGAMISYLEFFGMPVVSNPMYWWGIKILVEWMCLYFGAFSVYLWLFWVVDGIKKEMKN